MKGIILHGGHGTRLRPLTHTGPKQLLPIANKPMSQYCLESLKDAGITDIAIIIGGTGSNKVQEYYGNGERFGVKLTYISQDAPRGIAQAIRLCKEFVNGEKFVVFLGDNILKKSITEYIQRFKDSDASASILLCEVSNPTQFGIADIKDGVIKKIIEKPKDPPTNLAVTGIYLLTPTIFDIIDRLKPSWRNEYEITDALQMLLQEEYKIIYNMVTDYWKDTGTPQDIIHANQVILSDMKPYFEGKEEEDVIITGNVMIGSGTTIKNGSKLTGPVIIGKDCQIGPNANIGSNTSIGDNTKLSNCHIENSIIMSSCTIDGDFIIKDSIIAFNSEITRSSSPNKVFLLGEGTKISL
ncbi:glucose-1-phosphate thymidylyltransferase [Candidatus Nitrosotenuis cloacae]|uniref:Glucose-1-phosphate thymidylyltransferase n=1 Tax=Candidatus Nitrosotenuis cloacae TaxID=1603555 RepID=A0A3G1B3C7_9ARCH|nr:glucose-1-phosphate thymidylyltransferase [Candidatus Nitrosotenuis cloacae]AJZ76150.1 glucose-1-phosphate thymidylyltransferase [Candidatus Nitrosotenuis cloacae]